MASGTRITATLDPVWVRQMEQAPQLLRQAAEMGMRAAIEDARAEAVDRAQWNADGTIQRVGRWQWVVTGLSRATIAGYVVGDPSPYPLDGHTVTDLFKHVHRVDSGGSPHLTPNQEAVHAVLTMYMEYSPYLQEYEIAHFGNTVVATVIEEREQQFWSTVREFLERYSTA